MPDKEEAPIKIKRSRKRLYDPLTQENDKLKQEAPEPAVVQAECVQAECKVSLPEESSDTEIIVADHTAEPVPPPTEPFPLEVAHSKKNHTACAKKIIRKYVKWSAGTALIPLPIADVVAVTAIQLRMLKKLCDFYGITFSEHIGKALIGSLIGGVNVGLMSASLLKVVPVFGLPISISSAIVVSGAITYAVGIVFIHHFENGGTLADFNPLEHKENFASAYQEVEKQI